MGAIEISGAQQKFVSYLATGEFKHTFEELDPLLSRFAEVFIQPGAEAAVFALQFEDSGGVEYRRVDFQAIPYNARIGE